jgi:hypothetical protein
MALVKSKVATIGDEGSLVRAYGDLLVDLAADQSSVRRGAVRELAAYPEAAMALCDRLDLETSPSVRAVLFSTLIKMQTSDVAERLAALLRSEDVPLRNGAIEALQEMPEAVAHHLRALLSDPDSDVRIFAVNILGALQHQDAPQWLAEVIQHETHVNVCAAAVDALAEIGALDAVEALNDLRDRFSHEAFMVFAIDTAIRRIKAQ